MHEYSPMQHVAIIRANTLVPAQVVQCQYYDSIPCYKVREILTGKTEIYFGKELSNLMMLNNQAE